MMVWASGDWMEISKTEMKVLQDIKSETKNQNQISMSIGVTYSHTYNSILKLKERGFIKIEKQGSNNFVTITDRGKKLLDLMKGR